MRPSQNLIKDEFILPLITPNEESEIVTPKSVTKGLHDSTEPQEEEFLGT